MSRYLLATYAVQGQVREAPPTPEDMQAMMKRIAAVETEMDEAGTFVFGGALHDADTSTVLQPKSNEVVMTDGPFVEAKEHIAGFYIIDAEDLDEALAWARKVTAAIGNVIEVRPFRATGRVEA